MSLWTRMKEVVTADFHALLDEKEQKNPLAMLNHYLRGCEKETEHVRTLVERQAFLCEEFAREERQAQMAMQKRKEQAVLAQEAGEMPLYELAQTEVTRYEARIERLHEAKREANQELETLQEKFEEMKHKLKDMHVRRMEFMGRENVARARHGMNKLLQPSEREASYTRFDEMEHYLARLEREATTKSYDHSLDERFLALEKKEFQQEKKNTLS
ncbi:phage shock protein PspA [Fictibacillus macauensis ZFHKF-1]|uniref:Phage shock protein PspA n=1 Tax=Fictibacillus macauensis ZFHKF-1 TaxID=1196324 RepID=I8AJR4_9BACL|nr:PspA/IM30 family protein [Fictibacillus macauensis]EIT86022.1 phage shock protein PspA [Fictibacillus macauensis ZFHKF-1]